MKLIHKRVLSLLLSTALVLTLLPGTALAATVKNEVPYLDSDGTSFANNVTVMTSGVTELDSGWYLVESGNVTINSTLPVSGDVKLILADGANLTVRAAIDGSAGIKVPQGSSLSIYAQSTGSGMGKLTATGNGEGCGIGSDSNTHGCGNISIYGGRITATGGSGGLVAAGIGDVNDILTGFGTIAIYGGIVTATNGYDYTCPDIGGNAASYGAKILIKGGTVVSGRSNQSVNLGVGQDYLGISPPEIVIDGGSIHLGLIGESSLTDGYERPISPSPDVLTVPAKMNAAVSSVSIGGAPYGNGVYTDGGGKLYLNLPTYPGVCPVVVTMNDGSKYWAVYQPGSGSSITLVNAAVTPVLPETAVFANYYPQDITAYKLDPDGAFTGISNGTTALEKNQDYMAEGNTVIINQDYLKTLPAGVASLSFDGLNSTLKVSILSATAPKYVALGDSIADGYGLPGYDPPTLPLTAYPSIVGAALKVPSASFAQSGMNSSDLLASLSDPLVKASLSQAETVTLSIGSDDILIPLITIMANKLGCDPNAQAISSKLSSDMDSNNEVYSGDLNSLINGLTNNQTLLNAAIGFAQNFQDIIGAIKAAAPNAKIYVTNAYNPYEKIELPFMRSTSAFMLDEITDGYIKTLNSAFSANSPDYTLIDTYSAFLPKSLGDQNSFVNSNSFVNAKFYPLNLDPHPSEAGHKEIADMIREARGYILTPQAVTTTLAGLSGSSSSGKVAGAASQVFGLSPSEQAQLPLSQVATLEGLMQNTLHVAAPTVSAPVTTGFSGSAALPPILPTATGLTLATYGATGTKLTTIQQQPPAGMQGGTVAFDLTLTVLEGGVSQPVHSTLLFPITVTMPLPPNFVLKEGTQYHINHTLMNGTIEQLPVTIAGTPGHYTATYKTTSFSMFTLVGTSNGSSSGSNSGSSVSAPESRVTPNTFISDTNADFSVNGAYQFKITSQNGIAPLLTVGTPGVFETQLVRVSGNDYYFKLISVGKAGEKAGVYVNGVKLLAATVGTAAAPVKSDTTGSLKVAKGKTYTFKLTANGKPSFVCGNSAVFQVKFLRQSGKDYFYQVTAIGKLGQTAGFYLNSAKKPVAAASVA